MAKYLGCCLLQFVSIQSDCYKIIKNLTISLVLSHYNKPKKFDFVHQTVSPHEGVLSGHETSCFSPGPFQTRGCSAFVAIDHDHICHVSVRRH